RLIVRISTSSDCPLLHSEKRFSRDAVKDIDVAHFAGLQYGRNDATILVHVDEHGRRRQVEIPDVVMDQLMEPFQFSGIRIKRKKSVGIQVLASYGMVCVTGRRK